MKIMEKHIQDAVVQFLELDGWRVIRTDPVSDRVRGKGFGELGMPDTLSLRYTETLHYCRYLWIEFKAPGRKPKKHQAAWHIREIKRGALVVLVVDDFDDFKKWYMASGLNLRMK